MTKVDFFRSYLAPIHVWTTVNTLETEAAELRDVAADEVAPVAEDQVRVPTAESADAVQRAQTGPRRDSCSCEATEGREAAEQQRAEELTCWRAQDHAIEQGADGHLPGPSEDFERQTRGAAHTVNVRRYRRTVVITCGARCGLTSPSHLGTASSAPSWSRVQRIALAILGNRFVSAHVIEVVGASPVRRAARAAVMWYLAW